ncbi:MAG TPA: glycosyltransferase family 39 protein [Candidatus Eremiobacteraceae bacterium]|nr:glycosyltransferase family 39 protein [Candidatus Eremiobacteraceae bacterium]
MISELKERSEPATQGVLAPRSWGRRSAVLLVAVLVVCIAIIVRGIHAGEFSYNVDETEHAVTGLYAAALMQDHPAHPIDYTYQFYAQYPAIAVIHWPPLFYGFEGLSFLLLGANVVAARLTILAFALLGLTAWFEMVRDLQDEWTAALATALLAMLPTMLLFEKTVMLEIPCLSLCVAASGCWTKYLLYQKKSTLFWFVGFASAALLTKQNSVYLPLFCLASAIAVGSWRLLVTPRVLWSVVGVALIAGPYYFLAYRTHWQTTAMNLADNEVSGLAGAMFYLKSLPGQLGWTMLALSLLGLVTSPRWDRRKITLLMLSWIGACYVTFTLIGLKDARHTLYWLPPFTYFAAGMLTRMFSRPPLKAVAGAAAVVLLGSSLVSAWSYRRPYISGYSAAAKAITQIAPSGIILFDGDLPGNFIFFLRADDPHRHFLVLRKALYTTRIEKRWGSQELVHGREAVEDLLRRDGVRFIGISDHTSLDFEVQQTLRDMLQSKQFKLLGRFPIFSTWQPDAGNLLLYENEQWAPPADKLLTIRMLTLDHDLIVPFSQFDVVDNQEDKRRGTTQSYEDQPQAK